LRVGLDLVWVPSCINQWIPDPYYPLGTIFTVPRAYDILGPTKEWKGEQIKVMKLKIGKFNIKYKIKIKNTFFKTKFYYKPTCEVGSA
jgi:hypothetical protein